MAIAKIIKYEGDNSTFVWKSPIEDFNTMSQLIVHESQEAILFKNGQILDSFEAGRHTLQTQNIPVIKRIFNISTGGRTPFHCEIYFVNKTQQMAIKWGTDSQVEYMDPTYKFPLKIGASGEMSLSVREPRRLVLKLVGTEASLTREGLVKYFRAFLMSNIKTFIANEMQNADYSVFQADSHMSEFSESLKRLLTPGFEDYGLSLDEFFVSTIAKPEDDEVFKKFKKLFISESIDKKQAIVNKEIEIIEQRAEAEKTEIKASAQSNKREIEGYTYKDERSFDVARTVAKNESAGEFTSMGVGLGVMGGVGNAVGAIFDRSLSPAAKEGVEDFELRIEKLKIMKDKGLLSEKKLQEEIDIILESISRG